MSNLEKDSISFVHSLNQSIYSINAFQHYETMLLDGINNIMTERSLINKNHVFKMSNYSLEENYCGREIKLPEIHSIQYPHVETISLTNLQKPNHKDNNQTNCIIPPYYPVSLNEFNIGSSVLYNSLVEHGSIDVQSNGTNLEFFFESNEKKKHIPKDIQELIYALQSGGSRCKMEAAITVRSLATSHQILQTILIEAGGIGPLVELLKYKAEEAHWPIELREKATITVRAESALALASLAVSNDDNKNAIGAAGAIPLLCELIHFDENNCNSLVTLNYNSQEMIPFFILARDAGVGALSCLSKSEKNKEAIIATQSVPILVHMVDQGTSFGRAAAANVIAKLATGENASKNRLMLGHEAKVVIPLLRLLKHGSSKAKETAAEALENLALHDWNKTMIVQEGGIECLMQLFENGTTHEQEAAARAMKNLKSCIPSVVGSLEQGLSSGRCGSVYNVEGLNQSTVSVSGHTGNIEREELYKTMEYEDRNFTQKNETTTHVASISRGDELHTSNNLIHGNFQMSKDPPLWQENNSKVNYYFSTIQSISMSELTSTLAPPLVGQPSIQVDAIIENVKGPMQSIPNNKRLKMTTPDINKKNSHVQFKRGDSLGESKIQKFNHELTTDLMQMRYSDASKKNLDVVCWNNNSDLVYQRNKCFPPNEGYGLSDTIRDQQNKQCLVVDNQLVTSGIVALVNALSSSNPSAQEFATLALMLLASQGGFEIKTTISDAGAIPLLLTMVDSSPYPMIRESAAAAIAKLVSYHPINRARVLKGGGIKAMVNMAQWSTTLVEDASSIENLKARVQAAAIVAMLNLGNVQDRQNTGMGLRDALPMLVHMLESDDLNELEASVGGLQALSISLGLMVSPIDFKNLHYNEQGSLQTLNSKAIAIEMITVLLHLTRGMSKYAKAAALEALAGFKQNAAINGLMMLEPRMGLNQCDSAKNSQLHDYTRQDGVLTLLTMLANCPTSARENVTAAFASAMASDKLSIYIIDEGAIIQRLMMILEEGPTMATKVSAAASMATIGARKQRLDALSKEHILLLLQVLTSNEHENSDWKGSLIHGSSTTKNLSGICLMPHFLLREYITAIIVYTALSGDFKKQLLIAAGTAPILVGVLRGCLSSACTNAMQESWQYMQSISKNKKGMNGVPPYLHATQEFATMGLIMLADKSIETMENIVETGGISLLVQMLTATRGCRGKLGANWSEMAAAALLTLAGSNNARDEIVRIGGIASLVQVLKGEGGASGFSFIGLAAMAQLLGVLGLNSKETKVCMAGEGAVKCLVEILIGSNKCYSRPPTEFNDAQKLGYVALAQEAAAAALATVILHCEINAKAAVQAGAINHLVKLLGPLTPNHNKICNFELMDLLPSAYKLVRNGVSFTGCKATTSDLDFNHASECGYPKMNIGVDDDLFQTGSHVGGPLAAMAALGNMVSCYPQCWREIVDAGAAPRLANLLQGDTWMNGCEGDNGPPHIQEHVARPTKVQESAALVLDLLIDCEENGS